MKLVIVESPTKAKTLSRYLPKDEFIVTSSKGHIRDLPKKGLGVDVEHDFTPEYEIPSKAKKVISELKKLAKDADEIILATDPDREGEAIAWHLQYVLTPKRGKAPKFSRVFFHELTKTAVLEAFEHKTQVDENLVNAQQARRVLDRLVGYKLSPLLWKKVRYGLSAGRVQSVAVRLIVERERERAAFEKEEYWSVTLTLSPDASDDTFKAEVLKEGDSKLKITSQAEADLVESALKASKDIHVLDVVQSTKKRQPPAPFKTSTLQRSASNLFGFTAKRTMRTAQKLFEKGFITYHRTDSLNLAPEFVNSVRDYVSKKLGGDLLPEKPHFFKTKSKGAQEAHESIRPTDITRIPESLKLTPDEKKLYALIWQRALECQMIPAEYLRTKIDVGVGKYLARANGSVLTNPGWLTVGTLKGQIPAKLDLVALPQVTKDATLELISVEKEQHFTQPPARYSDATLIKKLEELGIGRPSTYAPTIATIESRKYVYKEARQFVPTAVAFVVTDLLVKHFPSIVDYDFTAEMETHLDEVATGRVEWPKLIRDFYEPFIKTLEEKDKTLNKRDVITLEVTDKICPKCGKHPLVVKLGKYGTFLSCSGYPECDYAEPMEKDKVFDENGNEITDFGKCDKCETGVFVLKQGRFGKFLACSNYPKCKNTKPYLDKVGVKCPKCGIGDVVRKKAKGREFFGCSRYPDCDWSSWKNPALSQNSESKSDDESAEK